MITGKLNFSIIAISAIVLWGSAGLAQSIQSDSLETRTDSIFAKDDTVKSSVKSPTGAMIRSLVIPGWGQFYNKKYFKAILVFGAEFGLLANSIYLNQQCQASDTNDEREFYINNRNLSNWWLLGVILLSMTDAFVDAHMSDFDENPDLSFLRMTPFGTDGHIGIQFSVGINF